MSFTKNTNDKMCIQCKTTKNLVNCAECKHVVCEEDYDYEYDMCYDCSMIVNAKVGYLR